MRFGVSRVPGTLKLHPKRFGMSPFWQDADRNVSVGGETWRNLGGLPGVPTETPKRRRDLWVSRPET